MSLGVHQRPAEDIVPEVSHASVRTAYKPKPGLTGSYQAHVVGPVWYSASIEVNMIAKHIFESVDKQ